MAHHGQYDVLEAWSSGQVPHQVPYRSPAAFAEPKWPHVPAGPDRLQQVMRMWIAGLQHEQKDSLRSFLSLVRRHALVRVGFIVKSYNTYKSLSSATVLLHRRRTAWVWTYVTSI